MNTLVVLLLVSLQVTSDAPAAKTDAILDLTSAEGLRAARAQWRTHDAKVVEVQHRSPGPDLLPSGPPNRTYDIEPHAGAAEYDDSAWDVLNPADVHARRSTGRLCFAWFRTKVTIPEKVGTLESAGTTVVFEIVIDDYAEVWVDGKLPSVLGQTGGPLIKGFNAPNRVVLTRDAHPGQTFQISVFGINGPLSNPPANFIWIRSATLDFHRSFGNAAEVKSEVDRRDPALDALLPSPLRVEKIAGGFQFTEGPVWIPDGYLLFSDPNRNTIYRWTPDGEVSVFRTKSGYAAPDIGEYSQPGSNGLTLDRQGRLTICQHGNRRVVRIEKTGAVTVLADRYQGKRLNSPNDLVYKSDGSLYFTDPPFGLPRFFEDPRKELPHSGVYRAFEGNLQLLTTEFTGPNGLAFSPDEQYLYVGNWDAKKKVIVRYPVKSDGTLESGRLFFDMSHVPGEQAIDGLKVDCSGNLYVSGPGGLWILSPAGTHLGTLKIPELPHNFTFGDDDGRTLYLAAETSVYRMRLNIPGIRP
jgi:gluconolactonase